MTKRFTETLSTGIVTDNVTGKEYDCEMRISDGLLNLLNKLHEENEALKHQLQQQELEYATTCNRLAEENEQLQEQRAELFIRERDTKNEWREIKQENESLKEENKFLRNKVATYKKGNALLKKSMDKEWK